MRKSQYPDTMLTQSALLAMRGWTRGLIKRFARIPDITKPNPRHRSGCRMKLFLIERIAKTEVTMDFVQAMASANIRKAAARRAYQTRLKNERAKAEARQKKVMQLIQDSKDRLADADTETGSAVDSSVDITCIPFVSDLRFGPSYENHVTGEDACQT